MKRDWRLLLTGFSALTGLMLILYGTDALIIYNVEFAMNPCGKIPGMDTPAACSYPGTTYEKYYYWSGVGMIGLSILSTFWTFCRKSK
jgi:hypothetical protein